MRTVKLESGNEFQIHESQHQLPISRYTDFQKYLLQDSGITPTVAGIDKHFKLLDTFLAAGAIDDAMRERHNLHIGLYLMINKINIEHLSFACLVDRINGKKIHDFSETHLIQVARELGEMGLTHAHVADILESVKKNSIRI